MTKAEYINRFWLYYLSLEDDFLATMNYVEFSPDNYDTYSKEYTKLFISLGSEIDIIFKALCREIDPSNEYRNISDYARVLCDRLDLINSKVEVVNSDENFQPFYGWQVGSNPRWWGEYNDIKHHRAEEDKFRKGNLGNVINSLSALFVLNRYLCKKICAGRTMKEPEIRSKLFEMAGWDICIYEGRNLVRVLRTNGNMTIMSDR